MLILTETGFQVHYDHYEVGLSDNDFLPVTNKAGRATAIWPWYGRGPGPRWGASQLFFAGRRPSGLDAAVQREGARRRRRYRPR